MAAEDAKTESWCPWNCMATDNSWFSIISSHVINSALTKDHKLLNAKCAKQMAWQALCIESFPSFIKQQD